MRFSFDSRPVRGAWLFLITALTLLALAAPAKSAFPGKNGKIAFTRDFAVYSMNPDGSSETRLTSGPNDFTPAWSPDGKKIAFRRIVGSNNDEIFVMNSDGTGQVDITNNPARDSDPAWSPDGSKIVFSSSRDWGGTAAGDIYTMNPDGSGVTRLTNDVENDYAPAWSPDGTKIAFVHHRTSGGFFSTDLHTMNADGSGESGVLASGSDIHGGITKVTWSPDGSKLAFDDQEGSIISDIYTINPDGTGKTSLTGDSQSGYDAQPAWSPDGTKIAFSHFTPSSPSGSINIWTMNPDGTGKSAVTSGQANERNPDWERLWPGYPRPRGATPLRASLVPAFKQCIAPGNRVHGPPLAFPSCAPPVQASNFLTVGTTDSNGAAENSTGYFRLDVVPHQCCPPQDFRITGTITDVRCRANTGGCGSANTTGGADYTGELQMNSTIRITDHNSGPNVDESATVVDIPLPVNMQCVGTPDPSIGGSCSVSSSVAALVPQASTRARAVVEIGQIQVYDGGASGVAGSSDATLFMDEGVFVP